jgi:hypothetical protein
MWITPISIGTAIQIAFKQMESFTRTIGDLHNAYFDAGMRKVSKRRRNARWLLRLRSLSG